MGRQLFLHHYLPAHLASALVAGALLEFVFNVEPIVDDAAAAKSRKSVSEHLPAREKVANQNLYASWGAAAAIIAALIGGWYFFLPLTYGYPGLTVPQVNARKWLGYDLHFAK